MQRVGWSSEFKGQIGFEASFLFSFNGTADSLHVSIQDVPEARHLQVEVEKVALLLDLGARHAFGFALRGLVVVEERDEGGPSRPR